jgi:PAS domain S-box-containing protein
MKRERKTIRFPVECSTALSLLGLVLTWSLLCLPVLAQASNPEQKPTSTQKVLLLYSQRKDGPYSTTFERVIQQTLNEGTEGRIDSYQEYIDEQRFFDQKYRVALRDFIRRKYEDQRYDLVIAIGGAAVTFAADYGNELFPETPVVFYGGQGRARPNFTGVFRWLDLRSTVDVALRLQPNTRNVFVISGSSERDQEIQSIARRALQPLGDRVAFTYVNGLTLDELLQKVANLPPDSIIYYLTMTRDRTGAIYSFPDAMSKICTAANTPVYGPTDWHLDNGALGGSVLDTESLAKQTAEIALRVLRGEKAEDIPLATPPPNINLFDWRQLRRFHISEARLPPGSIVRFKELTVWEQYKGRIIAILAILILQTLLLAGLLFERTRKNRATRGLAESEERFGKAFRANPQPMSLTTLAQGRYLDVNESFLRMSGYIRDEVIGHTSHELRIFENLADRDTLLVQPLLGAGVVRNFEMKFRTKSEAFRTLLSSAELLELAGERCILVASSDITERKTLEQELMHLTTQLFRLQDDERRRIARELHDGTAQNLFAISINLAKLDQLDETQKEEMHKLIAECVSLGDESLQEIRTLSYLLHPPLLDQAGLVSALQWYAQGFSKRSGIYVDVFAEPIDRLPADFELALFRIVQESLTNVRRHSGSETASIRLENRSDEIFLEIRDKGRGLAASKNGNDSTTSEELIEMGVGIPGMQQRLRQLGGRLEIDTNNDGTTITAVVPMANGAKYAASTSHVLS